jgi:hypothetical protein
MMTAGTGLTDRVDTIYVTPMVWLLSDIMVGHRLRCIPSLHWRSKAVFLIKRQSTTAASSTEAKYIAQYEAIKESESLRMFLDELDGMTHPQPGELYTAEPTRIYADNSVTITLATNPGMKSRAKHPRIALHWQRFGMQDSNGKTTPMLPGEHLDVDVAGSYLDDEGLRRYQSAVGALNYLCCMTRPDLAFTMSTLSKFNQSPQEQHHFVLQRTMRYLKETRTLGITYGLERNVLGEDHSGKDLYGYTDSDHAGTVVQEDSSFNWRMLPRK